MTKPGQIPTNVPGLDDAIGGFMPGDNVILQNTVGAPPHALLDAILRGSLQRGDQVVYVSFDATAQTMRTRLADLPGVTLVDCFTHGLGGPATGPPPSFGTVVHDPQFPSEFSHAMARIPRTGPRMLVFDSLNGMAMLWDESRVARHYATTCPQLFDAGDLAVWVLHEGIQSPQFHAQIGHIAQVILRLDRDASGSTLTVARAVGRPDLRVNERHSYTDAGGFRVSRRKEP